MAHKDVEYAVESYDGREKIFRSFQDACSHAVTMSVSHGKYVNIDILVWSKQGARSLYGDEGVEQYLEDPEASVFERIVIQAESVGRVP